VAAVAVVAGVSAEVVVAEVSVEEAEVSAGDHQVVVPPEGAVLGVYGTQAAGLRLPEATAPAAARVATIAEAGLARGTGAALIAEARPERGTGAAVRKHAAGGRMLAERRKADVRKQGQSVRTHAQIVSTSVAMM
jgi:hypothetical protein